MTVVLTMIGTWLAWVFVSEFTRALYDGLLQKANKRGSKRK